MAVPGQTREKNKSRGGSISGKRTVADVGEDALVQMLLRGLPAQPGVLLGPGDDCAVVENTSSKLLLKVDSVLEGVHFLRSHPAASVGWKAVARPLSDIAAMAGIPRHALVAMAVPAELPLAYLRGIFSGIRRAAREYGVALVGGETSRSPAGLVLSITLMGEVGDGDFLSRSAARDGDEIWVTGRLGGSYASGKHLRFRPRLAEARWLARETRPTSMMDLSDGLGADLPRLASRSGLGFALQEDKIPRSPGCDLAQALGDGEDYELLFTASPAHTKELPAKWRMKFPRLRLTRIGEMKTNAPSMSPVPGFHHF